MNKTLEKFLLGLHGEEIAALEKAQAAEQLEAAEARLPVARREREAAEVERNRLQAEQTKLRDMVEAAEARVAELERQRDDIGGEKAKQNQHMNALDAEISELEQSIVELKQQMGVEQNGEQKE